jgi:diguanylate cyclase (GGDEF)-like protein
VLLIDLDDFKAVNDGLGHAAGDELLIAVASRLLEATRASDTVARLGGDEFAILIEDQETLAGSVQVAERVLATLAAPFDVGSRTVFINASIGIARHDTALLDADTLRNADVAMYMAKGAGKGRYALFEDAMGVSAVSRIELEVDMRQALEKDPKAFVVHYQPIVDLSSDRIAGLEALVRWNHPSRGVLPPYDFLPVAEETGLIVPLGRVVLREACRQVAAWRRSIPGMEHLTVSVNLSSRQVEDGDLRSHVERALEDAGLEPDALILELTEDLLLKDAESVSVTLDSLAVLGVRISVDDFGAGNSSLSYLRRFPITELKIDKSCVDDLTGVHSDASLVRGLVRLGHALHLRMVAEGIEEPEQAAVLRGMGCESGQGFLFARPRASEEIANLLLVGVGAERAKLVPA